MVYEYRSTRDTGDSRQPLPHGGDSPIDTVPREETTTSRSHLILPEIRFPSPVHGYPDYRHALPAPSGGGGRRPRQRPGGGGVPRIPFNQRRRRQGRECTVVITGKDGGFISQNR